MTAGIQASAAMFGNDEFIFVENNSAGYWGYQFTAEGACLGRADPNYASTDFFDVDPDGIIYGVRIRSKRKLMRMNSAGKVLEEFPLPPVKFPNAEARFDQGGLIADGTHIFYASAGTLDILKLDPNGKLVDRISERNSWFRSLNKDLPADYTQVFSAMKDLRGTTIWSFFELTDETIMVQYFDRDNGTGYQVFTKDGVLLAEELGLNTLFWHVGIGSFTLWFNLTLTAVVSCPIQCSMSISLSHLDPGNYVVFHKSRIIKNWCCPTPTKTQSQEQN